LIANHREREFESHRGFDDKNIFAVAHFVVARIRLPNIRNVDRIMFNIFNAFQRGDARLQHVTKNSPPK
jgi:hypothetical protein